MRETWTTRGMHVLTLTIPPPPPKGMSLELGIAVPFGLEVSQQLGP
jgi:hypothetical protein